MFLLGKNHTQTITPAETGFLGRRSCSETRRWWDFRSQIHVPAASAPFQGTGSRPLFFCRRAHSFSPPSTPTVVVGPIAGRPIAHGVSRHSNQAGFSYGAGPSAVTGGPGLRARNNFPAGTSSVGRRAGAIFIAQQDLSAARRDPEVSEGCLGKGFGRAQSAERPPAGIKCGSPRNMGSSLCFRSIAGHIRHWSVLAALGYLSTAYLGIRPWTRMGVRAVLLEEIDESMRYHGRPAPKGQLGK